MATGESQRSVCYKMTFPERIVGEPIMSRLSNDFHVTYNMMRGRITEKGAWLEVQLAGSSKNIEKALKYLGTRGVSIEKLP